MVAVIKIVWLKISSNESVGVVVAAATVATTVAVATTVEGIVAATVGLTVMVGINTDVWGVGSVLIVMIGAGRAVGSGLFGVCVATVGMDAGLLEAAFSLSSVPQLCIIKTVMSSTQTRKCFHVK